MEVQKSREMRASGIEIAGSLDNAPARNGGSTQAGKPGSQIRSPRLSGLAGVVVFRVGGRLSRVVAGVIAFAFASRALGPNHFGDYVVVFAFIQLFLVFATFGVDRILLRDLPQPEASPGEHEELVRVAVTARVLMSIMVGGAAISLSVLLGFSDRIVFSVLYFSPFILVTALSSSGLLGTVLQVHGRSGSIVAANVASSFVVIVGTLVAVIIHANTDVFLLVYTLSSAVDLLACLVRARGVFALRMSWNGSLMRYLMLESYPLAIASGFALVYGRIDIVLLEKLTDPTQVALYGVAYKYFDVLTTVALTAMVVIAPALSRAYADLRRASSVVYSEIFTLMLAAALPIAFSFFVLRSWLLLFLVGHQFLDAQAAIPGLLLAITFVFMSSVASHMTLLVHRQRWNLAMAGGACALNIVLNILLIPRFGYVASAWVTAATEAFVLIFYLFVVGGLGHLAPSPRSIALVLASAVPFALVLVPHIPWYVSASLGLLLYVTLLFTFGILRPARLRAVLERSKIASAQDWKDDSMLQDAVFVDAPTMLLAAVRPGIARHSWQTSHRIPAIPVTQASASSMLSSAKPSWQPAAYAASVSSGQLLAPQQQTPRRGPSTAVLVTLGILIAAALSTAIVAFMPFGVEIVALLVFAAVLLLVAVRAQWALLVFVVLLPLHNLLMALLYQATGDATLVKLMQPWKEIVLGIALLRAGLPALLAWRRTRQVHFALLDMGVLAFVGLAALNVLIPSHSVPISGRANEFHQLVAPLLVYFVGRLALPSRREVKALATLAAASVAIFGLYGMLERSVFGNALPISIGLGSYLHAFFGATSYLPYEIGQTFYTGSPQWLPRAGSLSVNPLDFATLMMIYLPVVLATVSALRTYTRRATFLPSIGVTVVAFAGAAGIMLSFSRTNLLLFPVELILLMLLVMRNKLRFPWPTLLAMMAGGLAGFVLFMQAAAYVLTQQGITKRVNLANQGLLSSTAFTVWDMVAPSFFLVGAMLLVFSVIAVGLHIVRRRRLLLPRKTILAPLAGLVLAIVLLAGVTVGMGLNGLHLGLLANTFHGTVPGISSMASPTPGTTQPGGNPSSSGTGAGGVVGQAANPDNSSTQWHLQSYGVLATTILHRPWGYGLGAAARMTGKVGTSLHIESAYVPVAFDLGVPGILLYLAILVGACFACLRGARARGDALRRALFLGAGVAWLFTLADGVVRDISTSFFVLIPLWWLAGTAVTHRAWSRVIATRPAPGNLGPAYQVARPLRVAMDVQCLHTARTGVRAYVTQLLKEFELGDIPHEVIPLSGPRGLPRTNVVFRMIDQAINLTWLHVVLPMRLSLGNYDVLFSPEYLTPVWSPVQNVVTYHDSAFLRRPQDYNRLWQLMFRKVNLPALRRADAVIVPSRFAKGEAIHYAKLSPERVHVTPLGGPRPESMRVSMEVARDSLERFDLRSGHYLLHVGVLERRKNLPLLVEAFHQLTARGIPDTFKLVLVGQPGPRPDLNDAPNIRSIIERLGLQKRVVLTGHLPGEAVNALLANAFAYVLPSKSEGFGIPVLEAFAAGIPVVCSTAGALPEVAGDAALLFDPDDREQLVACLIQLGGDPTLREALIQAGRERAQSFTWKQTALETSEAFEAAVLHACPVTALAHTH